MKIGIIDSGIDHLHPFFDDDSTLYSDGDGCLYEVSGDGEATDFEQFTNCKVIVAKVFHPDTRR